MIPEVVPPEYYFKNFRGMEFKGPDGYKQLVMAWRNAFPDLHMREDHLFAEGDKLAARVLFTGTMKGRLLDFEPTGNKISFQWALFYRFENGKQLEAKVINDRMTLHTQAGLPLVQAQNNESKMGIEENKKLVRQFFERTGKGDTSAVDEVMTSDFVFHAIGAGANLDREALKKTVSNINAAFSDSTTIIENIVAEGDKVSTLITVRGTYTGKFQNIEPTGRNIAFTRIVIHRFEKGKIAEGWTMLDRLGIYQQMGVLPPTEEIGK